MHVCRDTYPRLYSNDERVITAAAGLSIVYAVYLLRGIYIRNG
jgi:hypothetical protein